MKHVRAGKTPSSRSVLKALAILEALGESRHAQSLAAMSRQCRVPKATALRYLAAFEQAGYATRDPGNGGYFLGAKVMDLGRRFYEQYETLSLARDHLAELASETGETAHLAVLHVPDVVYIDIAESPQRIRAYVVRGERLPAYCVASGHAILAHSEPNVIDAIVDAGMARQTRSTITTRAGLIKELRRTATRGYATTLGEWREDVIGISSPLSSLGSVVGAIGVSCPLSRTNQKRIETMGKMVRSIAERIASFSEAGKAKPIIREMQS